MYTYPIRSNEIYHYGIKRRSGRYPWGSGKEPYQSLGGKIKQKAKDIYTKYDIERTVKSVNKNKDKAQGNLARYLYTGNNKYYKKRFEKYDKKSYEEQTKLLSKYGGALTTVDSAKQLKRLNGTPFYTKDYGYIPSDEYDKYYKYEKEKLNPFLNKNTQDMLTDMNKLNKKLNNMFITDRNKQKYSDKLDNYFEELYNRDRKLYSKLYAEMNHLGRY